MNKMLASIAIVAFAAGVYTPMAQAGGKYGMAGCGLASMVFEDDARRDEKWKQIVLGIATDYLGLGGTATSAMTSGTSNCTDTPANEMAANFIELNKDALASDIARGQGEALASYSQIIGCSDVDAVGSTLQQNFDKVFANPEASGHELNDGMQTVLNAEESCA